MERKSDRQHQSHLAYTQYLDNWDEGGQSTRNYETLTIAFSPQWIAHQSLSLELVTFMDCRIMGFCYRWDSRFVHVSTLDNTEDPDASLDPMLFTISRRTDVEAQRKAPGSDHPSASG